MKTTVESVIAYILPYKFPRLKAINIMIAGPAVITRNNAPNCNTVVALNNILTPINLINYSSYSNTFT
jgi:hypothetical protein